VIEFFKFQWLCAKEARRGSFNLANAWSGLWGPVLIWLGSYWWGRPLTLPDRLDGYAVGLGFAFLAATWVGLLVARFFAAPAELYWQQNEKARGLEDEIIDLKVAGEGSDSGPDWPIHEVFSYLEPDVLERPDDNLWQKAGDEIRDALSLGRLRIWGRLHKTNLGDWVGERAALRLIDKKYWEKAFFTYIFFDSSAQDATHCYSDRDTGRPAYTDLQVNRAEVLKLWPGEPGDLAEGYPNVRLADSPAAMALFDGLERAKIIALLTQEKLSSWARVSASQSHDFVLLGGGVWTMSTFRCDPKNPDDRGTINQTYLRQRQTLNAAFYDVCMNFAQLKRAWPSLEIRRTKCDIV
jgi:hypothetical protein